MYFHHFSGYNLYDYKFPYVPWSHQGIIVGNVRIPNGWMTMTTIHSIFIPYNLIMARRNPDFSQMPREHVDAIANLSNSRGASACVYGIAVLAVLLVGDQGGFEVGPKNPKNTFFGSAAHRS